jgi:predicted NAD/FAD-binding protein
MNRLQHLPAGQDYIVTLNGQAAVDPDRVISRMEYAHPAYTPESVAARSTNRSARPMRSRTSSARAWIAERAGRCRPAPRSGLWDAAAMTFGPTAPAGAKTTMIT